jgi:hypothetical protein
LTQRLDSLNPDSGDRVIYSVGCLVASPEAAKRGRRRLKHQAVQFLAWGDAEESVIKLDDPVAAAKQSLTHYHCFVLVTVESQAQERLEQLSRVSAELNRFSLIHYNGLAAEIGGAVYATDIPLEHELANPTSSTRYWGLVDERYWRLFLMALTPPEIASLWHLPDSRFTAHNISGARRQVPKELTGEKGDRLELGSTLPPAQTKTAYLAVADRAHHHYITGKTGTGKSTFLGNLIHQDIAAGRGLVLIDPHGQLVDDILSSSIPQARQNDVDLLDCGNLDHPVPLNPFVIPLMTAPIVAFNSLYWVLRRLYEKGWSETRMDTVLTSLIPVLLTDPDATPMDIRRFFDNPGYRNRLLHMLAKNENVSIELPEYWRSFFSGAGLSEQREAANPIFNRTRAFLGNNALSLMTVQPQTLPYQKMIREKRIVLVDLSGKEVKAEADTLGAIFMAGFYMAIQTLKGHTGQEPRFYMYVDEVEKFVTSMISEILSEVRKSGLSVTLANQYLNQLPDKTLDGILGNVGTLAAFAVSDDDARRLERYFLPGVDRDTLIKLSNYHMAVKTRYLGKDMDAFVVRTPPPPRKQPLVPGREQYRMSTVKRYGFWKRQTVREWQVERYLKSSEETDKSVGELPYYDNP